MFFTRKIKKLKQENIEKEKALDMANATIKNLQEQIDQLKNAVSDNCRRAANIRWGNLKE